MSASLEARLLTAHEADDRLALITLYGEAGHAALAEGREEAGSFYLTHAYVYALEIGAPVADHLRAQLVALGREEAPRP